MLYETKWQHVRGFLPLSFHYTGERTASRSFVPLVNVKGRSTLTQFVAARRPLTERQKALSIKQGGVDMPTILKYIEYFVEHLKELLIDHCNPILRARYFGVLFDKMPSYAEIDCGTPENEKVPEVNELFKLVLSGTSSLVH